MADPLSIDRSHIEAWLSAPRYKRYLEIAENDDKLALDLYVWNIGLAQAVLRDVSFFEVALRNAYDRAISATWSGSKHWLFDDASPVRHPILRTNKRGKVKDANRLNRNAIDHLAANLGHDPSPDKVISNLTLGFWAHMTDRSHERDLWIPSIHLAWPKGTSRDAINRKIAEINNVRNRAAHHEHLFASEGMGCSTLRACQDAVALFALLEPAACEYVYERQLVQCSVSEFVTDDPAPCSVVI